VLGNGHYDPSHWKSQPELEHLMRKKTKTRSSSNGCELVCLAPPRENWPLAWEDQCNAPQRYQVVSRECLFKYTSVEESKKLVVLVVAKANTVVLHLQIFAIIRRTHHFTVEE
jgi:hypothetical protein